MILMDFWQNYDFLRIEIERETNDEKNKNKNKNWKQCERGHLTQKYAKSKHKNITVKLFDSAAIPIGWIGYFWHIESNHKSEFYDSNVGFYWNQIAFYCAQRRE